MGDADNSPSVVGVKFWNGPLAGVERAVDLDRHRECGGRRVFYEAWALPPHPGSYHAPIFKLMDEVSAIVEPVRVVYRIFLDAIDGTHFGVAPWEDLVKAGWEYDAVADRGEN